MALIKGLMKIPGVSTMYMKGLLKALDNSPRHKLPPHLQQLQQMMAHVPKDQRLALMKAGMKGELPKPDELSREMRRTAQKQVKRQPPRKSGKPQGGKKRK